MKEILVKIMNLEFYKFQRVILLISIFVFVSMACERNAKLVQPIAHHDTDFYVVVDSYPKLITSEENYDLVELPTFINKHLQWPKTNLDCQGKVYISFIVEKDGSLTNKKFAKRLCSGFDEKAMEVIDLMKTWQPGTINNEPVRTLMTLPINFNLN